MMDVVQQKNVWVCSRCGYMEEGEHAPDLCPFPDCGAGPDDFYLQA